MGMGAAAAPKLTGAIEWIKKMAPQGNQISEESWHARHKAIVALVWVHVLVLPWLGIITKHGVVHSMMEGAVVGGLALLATMKIFSNPTRSVFATVGLVTSSAILTHFFGGLIEMHFHFFVMVAVVTLYQSWLPFAFAISYVLVHHGLAGAIDPESVFNHSEALRHPWKWASIHAFFIAGESIACMAAWRLNELALESERAARSALEKANGDLAEAQQLARIGSWEWDVTTDAVEWSAEFYRICGLDPSSFTPTPDAFLQIIDESSHHKIDLLIGEIRHGREAVEVECGVVRPDGEVRIVRLIGTALLDPSGMPHRMVGTCQDITDQKELELEIHHKAFHDPLTGLANRALFLDRLALALKRREPGEQVGVIFVDLDDFKSINDSMGHAAGDEMLVGIAQLLQSVVRPSDTIARFGGDEFAILIEKGRNTSATHLAERFKLALSEPLEMASGELMVTASMGIAIATETSTPDELMRDADIAMYAVKTDEKKGYLVCDTDMRSSVLRKLELKSEIEQALDNGEFRLHYQPIIQLATQEIVALEALIRWDHPRWGLIGPDDFVPLAEESGFIVPLGEWVIKNAIAHAAHVQCETGRKFALSVNLSARQLYDADIVPVVKRALEANALDPEDLILEITETILMSNKESCIQKLAALRALGTRIAIDDFGTGYSSLSYLHQLPVDVLKVDRAFVAGVTEGPEEAALAQAVIKIAKVLNLTTIAEGIETEAQLKKLMRFGCKVGQGHLFARALNVEQLAAWMKDSGPEGAVIELPTLVSA
jgi:diguanylate cyclase (GGDEF)-like protein/PAS domain S-box-containing protein